MNLAFETGRDFWIGLEDNDGDGNFNWVSNYLIIIQQFFSYGTVGPGELNWVRDCSFNYISSLHSFKSGLSRVPGTIGIVNKPMQ